VEAYRGPGTAVMVWVDVGKGSEDNLSVRSGLRAGGMNAQRLYAEDLTTE